MNITKDGACNWVNRVKRAPDAVGKDLGKLLHMQVVATPNGHGNDHVLTMVYENGRAYFDGKNRKEVYKAPVDPNAWAFENNLESF